MEKAIFPRDFDTLEIIREVEEILKLEHRKIDDMSNLELIEYINQITLNLLNN